MEEREKRKRNNAKNRRVPNSGPGKIKPSFTRMIAKVTGKKKKGNRPGLITDAGNADGIANVRKGKVKNKIWKQGLTAISCGVVFCTAYSMILPAITVSKETYCEIEEHTHSEECYLADELQCGLEEGEGHAHTDDCYSTELICTNEDLEHGHDESCYQTVLTCSKEESIGHTHSEDCYKSDTLQCGKEEHKHSLQCYSNPKADVETAGVWESTIPDKLEDSTAKRILQVAKSQLNYSASTENYQVDSQGIPQGYTRYGERSNDPYGDWNSYFTDFVLRYAEIVPLGLPSSTEELETWINENEDKLEDIHAEGFSYKKSDLVFVRDIKDTDNSIYLGFVSNTDPICFIAGDIEDSVKEVSLKGTKVTSSNYSKLDEDSRADQYEIIACYRLSYENDAEDEVNTAAGNEAAAESAAAMDENAAAGYVPGTESDNQNDSADAGNSEDAEVNWTGDKADDQTVVDESDPGNTDETEPGTTDENDLNQTETPEIAEGIETESGNPEEMEGSIDGSDEENPATPSNTQNGNAGDVGETPAPAYTVTLVPVDENGNPLGDEFNIVADREIDLKNINADTADTQNQNKDTGEADQAKEYSDAGEAEEYTPAQAINPVQPTITTKKAVELTGAEYQTTYEYQGALFETEDVYSVSEYWIEFAEGQLALASDAEIKLVYKEARSETTYVYEDDDIVVKATTSSADTFPDDAVFKVTPITEDSLNYNYEAYYNAAINAGASENMLLYDFAFYKPQADSWLSYRDEEEAKELIQEIPEQLPLVELQPENGGTVTFEVTFKNDQLNEIGGSEESSINVIHLPLTDELKAETTTTYEAYVENESVIDSEIVDAEIDSNALVFSVDSLSAISVSLGIDSTVSLPLKAYVTLDKGSNQYTQPSRTGTIELYQLVNNSWASIESFTIDSANLENSGYLEFSFSKPTIGEEISESLSWTGKTTYTKAQDYKFKVVIDLPTGYSADIETCYVKVTATYTSNDSDREKTGYTDKNSLSISLYSNESYSTAISNSPILFALTQSKIGEALEANEISASDIQGTTINLFDYWLKERNTNDSSSGNDSHEGGINAGHALKFRKSASGLATEYNKDYNKWTGNANPYQNIVNNLLGTSGYGKYPVINTSTTGTGTSAESLSYLFCPEDTTHEGSGRLTFANAEGLLQKDSDEYIWFDSDVNNAYYDEAEGRFILYNQPGILYTHDGSSYHQFFPFTDPTTIFNYTENTDGSLDLTAKSGVTANAQHNHYFGLSMETKFYLTEDGTYNNKDMVFQFSGDDDVWIFIDDVLVGDIGGIHDMTTLDINFRTGKIDINGSSSTTYDTTIKRRFIDAYGTEAEAEAAGYTFKGNTLANDGEEHILRLFYLERGNTASDLMMKWNLKTYSLSVKKELDGVSAALLGDPDYTFTLAAADKNGSLLDLAGTEYYVTTDGINSDPMYLGADGEFTLKAGQKALFSGLSYGTNYTVSEKVPDNYNQYKYVELNGTKIDTTDGGQIISQDNFTSYTYSGILNGTNADLTFTNVVNEEKLGKLAITKDISISDQKYSDINRLISFPVSITLKDQNGKLVEPVNPVSQSELPICVITDSSGKEVDSEKASIVNGVVNVNVYPGYTTTLEGLLAGTQYTVAESTTNYQAEITDPSGVIQVSEEISTDQDGKEVKTYNVTSLVSISNIPYALRVFKYSDANNAGIARVTFELKSNGQLIKFKNTELKSGDQTLKVYVVSDDVAADSVITTDTNGNFILLGLSPGTYNLTETKAADGYSKLSSRIEIVIDENRSVSVNEYDTSGNLITANQYVTTESSSNQINIKNVAGKKLPETGGSGTSKFIIYGSILLGGSLILLCLWRQGKERRLNK